MSAADQAESMAKIHVARAACASSSPVELRRKIPARLTSDPFLDIRHA
jgi:hypothetical protein